MHRHQPIGIVRRILSTGVRSDHHKKGSGCRNVTTISTYLSWEQQERQQLVYSRRRGGHRSFSTTRDDNNKDDGYDYSNEYNNKKGRPKTALVVGSSGSLGRTLTKHLTMDLGVRVIGADVVEPRKNDEAYLKGGFVELPTIIPTSETTMGPAGLADLTMALTDGLYQLLEGGNDNRKEELDAVICVAGAWEGDPDPLPPFSLNDNNDEVDDDEDTSRRLWLAEGAGAYAENIERMMGKNLYPVLAAGYASQHYMTAGGRTAQDEYGEFIGDDDDNDGGLFVAIGATVALGGTPGMLGYGLSKVATHHYLQTLGETSGKAVTHKSKRKSTRRLRLDQRYLNKLSVVGILPTTIDTPANRQAMPDANFEEWTKSFDIAREIGMWLREPALRPHSGSLVKVHPKKKGIGGAEFRVAR
jgi:dihydropteridine reductase